MHSNKAIKSYNRSIHLFILILVIVSCSTKESSTHKLTLDPKYKQVQSISTFAHCKGPNGNYTTKIMSSSDGSCYFSQVTASNKMFTARITADLKGYAIDSLGTIIDTLSNEAVEMIRSHDFHRLHTNPQHFYNSITYDHDIDNSISLYHGIDNLQNPVSIYYVKNTRLISKIELLNPMDTTEVIEIISKKWVETDYGKMVKEIEIIQARRDTFYFVFERIKINE